MNIRGNLIEKLLFYRQHPETALRYLPVVELITKKRWKNLNLLEVGSGVDGIAPYLKRPITGLDVDFSGDKNPYLKQVKGSAINIPFEDKFFDLILLSDVLEHIEDSQRKVSLKEAIRVSKKAVIIIGPFGKEAFKQDQELVAYLLQKKIKPHYFLEEHIKYGLPDLEKTIKIIEKDPKVKSVKIIGSYFNLTVRKMLMKIALSGNKLLFYFYLKPLMLMVPLLRILNFKPCYRVLILVTLR